MTARHLAAADADAETTLFGSSCFSAAAAVGDITAAAMAVEMDADVTTAVSGSSCSSAAAAAGAMETDAALAADPFAVSSLSRGGRSSRPPVKIRPIFPNRALAAPSFHLCSIRFFPSDGFPPHVSAHPSSSFSHIPHRSHTHCFHL